MQSANYRNMKTELSPIESFRCPYVIPGAATDMSVWSPKTVVSG
jgi:hypothetical protein